MTSTAQPVGNIPRLEEILGQSDFDVVVAISPENTAYTSGVFIGSQRGIRDRLALVVWPKAGAPAMIVCTIEEPQARAESFIADVRSYVEFKTSPIEVLVDVLREMGLERSRIGFESHYLSAHFFEEMITALPSATFVGCDELFSEVRMIKTGEEIARLTHAAQRTERALLATYATIHSGESEKSMTDRLANAMMLSGAHMINFLYINAGPNTGYPHCLGTTYPCKTGDIVKTDCGATYDGYISDVARTGVLGKPSEEQRSIYARLLEIHHECIDMVRPGTRASDIFAAMTKGHQRAGLPFPLPHAGHSVGMAGHETPILSPFDHTELQPNMMFYVETRVRWLGKVGYHIEDLVLTNDGAPTVLTGFFPTNSLFEI
jgi:Xaa-Pro aminopeptidase